MLEIYTDVLAVLDNFNSPLAVLGNFYWHLAELNMFRKAVTATIHLLLFRGTVLSKYQPLFPFAKCFFQNY